MVKFDLNDISLFPSEISSISSRSDIDIFLSNKNLPIYTAPMDTVINMENIDIFNKNKINTCLPRYLDNDDDLYFHSYGLDDVIDLFELDNLPKKLLIDVANGNMFKLWDLSRRIKEKYGSNIELMIGNIANPKTYKKYCEIGVDYVRCGIGNGSVCTTSANVSINYPMGSLISECFTISKDFKNSPKIIADGGFRNYSDIIKALALGANGVMVGNILSKTLESCGSFFTLEKNKYKEIDNKSVLSLFNDGIPLYKKYRGMSTKDVQKSWNKTNLKTAEEISIYNNVEYTLAGWVENFEDYLKSAMSYCNTSNLEEFIGNDNWIMITQNAYNRFNK